jgi:uncharacterized membrane protein
LVRGAVWVLLGVLVLRFAAMWLDVFAGVSIPVQIGGSIGFTLVFTTFSVLHAGCVLGWRRAVAFFTLCAVVTWSFEAVGIATGLVYGAYHYGTRLGPKLGAVPVIIPLAWFMMVYASWTVASLLISGVRGPGVSSREAAARVVAAAMVMTAWDTVMDPGMARSGAWVWEHGGGYFGVPERNFVGWVVTTGTVYALAEVVMRWVRPGGAVVWAGRGFRVLPAVVYGLVAVDRILLPTFPELRVVAVFGMGLVTLLSWARVCAGE